ncbi:MAG: NifU family protein [Bacteroidota bacterium]
MQIQARPLPPPPEATPPEATRPGTADSGAIVFERLAHEVDAALEGCRVLGDDGRRASMRLKKALEGFQKHVLAQIVRGLKEDPRGRDLLLGLLDDPAVLSSFTVHGLLRPDLNARVAEVVEGIRDYAKSHGGDVEFVRVERDEEGAAVAFVRMRGNCSGCSLSALTLKRGVEDRLTEEVPEIARIEVLPTPPGAGIELTSDPEATGWIEGPPFVTMRHGEPMRLEHDGYDVLLIRYDEKVYAYRNACAHMGAPVHAGLLDETVLACPLHGFKYDLTSGECLSVPQAQLEPFPLRVDERGVVLVLPS